MKQTFLLIANIYYEFLEQKNIVKENNMKRETSSSW